MLMLIILILPTYRQHTSKASKGAPKKSTPPGERGPHLPWDMPPPVNVEKQPTVLRSCYHGSGVWKPVGFPKGRLLNLYFCRGWLLGGCPRLTDHQIRFQPAFSALISWMETFPFCRANQVCLWLWYFFFWQLWELHLQLLRPSG